MEYRHDEVVRRIADRIAADEDISLDELVNLVGGDGSMVNCYPSKTKGPCQNVAYFISLTPRGRRTSAYLSLDKVLKYFVSHMQGTCKHITKEAIIITDNWNPQTIKFWMPNIISVQQDNKYVTIFLITPGGGVTPVLI